MKAPFSQSTFVNYLLTTFAAIVLLVLIRLFELFILHHYGINEISFKILFKYSINFDFCFALLVSIVFLIPFSFIAWKSEKIALLSYRLLWLFLIIITSAFTHFFLSGEYLLSSVIFNFSWDEIWHIISIEGGTNRKLVWLLYFVIPFAVWFFFFRRKSSLKNKTMTRIAIGIYVTAAIIVLGNYKHYYKPSYQFDSQYHFYIGNNKILYFTKTLIRSRKNATDLSPEELELAIHDMQSKFEDFHFISSEYPFMHDEEYANVLGPYFKKSKKKPNLVFIISEGLGAGFSGLHPTADHLLPYIDTLAMNGLYWENFLSDCHRTFGVLPNVFSSLIPGTEERGFVNFNGENFFGKRYPDHNSLINELRMNDYFTSFFYGGWGAFDNYQAFLEDQKIDIFFDQDDFDSTRYLSPWKRKPEGFYWGYDDRAVFQQFIDYENKNGKIQNPYLSIYLTLNAHEPYNIAPKSYYQSDFIQKRMKTLRLRKDSPFLKKDNHTLGSLFYYEDALRDFINEYKKRADYDNTIFFIFGDHFSINSNLNSSMGIYHVPFIIYSPLIQKNEIFKGVSTHQDILPSLLALLKNNFGMKVTKEKHWIGQGLDTSKVFRSNRIAPLDINTPDFPHFLYKNYFLTEDGTVLKIGKNLHSEVVTDKAIIQKINKIANQFNAVNKYACTKNKIWKHN